MLVEESEKKTNRPLFDDAEQVTHHHTNTLGNDAGKKT
jgi:hypothetical protein